MAGIAGYVNKWMEMAGNGFKRLEWLKMAAGNCYKWLEIAVNSRNVWKWLEMTKNGQEWKWNWKELLQMPVNS